VVWTDDNGPCHATATYPADRLFPIRVPAREDLLLVRQGIHQAIWSRREIAGPVARLIAAHLHPGPRSALYRFAVTGTITERLYQELGHVARSRPVFRRMGGHVSPPPRSPIRHRTRSRMGIKAARPGPAAFRRTAIAASGHTDSPTGPWVGRDVSTDTAGRLIEAAFALGKAYGRIPSPKVRRLPNHRRSQPWHHP
jgi:hypothetical protein